MVSRPSQSPLGDIVCDSDRGGGRIEEVRVEMYDFRRKNLWTPKIRPRPSSDPGEGVTPFLRPFNRRGPLSGVSSSYLSTTRSLG